MNIFKKLFTKKPERVMIHSIDNSYSKGIIETSQLKKPTKIWYGVKV